jgi:hypothetical protein
MVDGAQRDPRLRDHARHRGRLEAVLGHHAFGGVQDELA